MLKMLVTDHWKAVLSVSAAAVIALGAYAWSRPDDLSRALRAGADLHARSRLCDQIEGGGGLPSRLMVLIDQEARLLIERTHRFRQEAERGAELRYMAFRLGEETAFQQRNRPASREELHREVGCDQLRGDLASWLSTAQGVR
jgi:hypothetical protein